MKSLLCFLSTHLLGRIWLCWRDNVSLILVSHFKRRNGEHSEYVWSWPRLNILWSVICFYTLYSDGPGAFDFIQGANTSEPQWVLSTRRYKSHNILTSPPSPSLSNPRNPFWEIVKGAVTPQPNAEQAACQSPKPILLNTGYAHFPYEWSPSTVDIQLMRVGNFVMLIMPGELTTMSGRRMRWFWVFPFIWGLLSWCSF